MKGPGSPNWRKAGRPAKGDLPAKAAVTADLSDLDGLTPEQIREKASDEGWRLMFAMARSKGQESRNLFAKLAVARELMAYSTAKPAQATTVSAPGGGPVETKHTIVFGKVEKEAFDKP